MSASVPWKLNKTHVKVAFRMCVSVPSLAWDVAAEFLTWRKIVLFSELYCVNYVNVYIFGWYLSVWLSVDFIPWVLWHFCCFKLMLIFELFNFVYCSGQSNIVLGLLQWPTSAHPVLMVVLLNVWIYIFYSHIEWMPMITVKPADSVVYWVVKSLLGISKQ